MKFSLIIPTLWKSEQKFRTMLNLYDRSYMVGEIIVINNNPDNTPLDFLPNLGSKHILLNQRNNIYVNPSWNLGVDRAHFDYIALVNDDILMDEQTLDYILKNSRKLLYQKHYELIGMAESNFGSAAEATPPRFKEIQKKGYGFGTFMLMKKENYVPIPSYLKIWRGDHILLTHNRTAELSGIHIETKMSETIKSDPNLTKIGRQDMQLYKLNDLKNKTLPKFKCHV